MTKTLVRSNDESQIFGVCAGIAHTYDIDISIVRIVAFCSMWFSGIGIIAYIAAYFILPEQSTRRSRLHHRD